MVNLFLILLSKDFDEKDIDENIKKEEISNRLNSSKNLHTSKMEIYSFSGNKIIQNFPNTTKNKDNINSGLISFNIDRNSNNNNNDSNKDSLQEAFQSENKFKSSTSCSPNFSEDIFKETRRSSFLPINITNSASGKRENKEYFYNIFLIFKRIMENPLINNTNPKAFYESKNLKFLQNANTSNKTNTPKDSENLNLNRKNDYLNGFSDKNLNKCTNKNYFNFI